MTRRWLLILLAGCFSKPPPPFDRCAPQPIDAPARYAFRTAGTAIDFVRAQDVCADLGMELLSINSADELAEVLPAIQQAVTMAFIYTGTRDVELEDTWIGVDACPAHTFFSPGEPNGAFTENCTAIDPEGMFDGPCTETTGGFMNVKIAGCELARWPNEECLAEALAHGALTLDPTPRSLDDARTFCTSRGARVIEIESSAELDAAISLAAGTTFWLGARQAGRNWGRLSEIKCPQVLRWRTGEPMFSAGECAAYSPTGTEVRACSSVLATICEAD